MRNAEESQTWSKLKSSRSEKSPQIISVDTNVSIDLSIPCLVIGGRNGAGKSRLLRILAESLGNKSLLIDLYHLCEQALIILRSRDDFDAMAEEYEVIGPNPEQVKDMERIIGREYESIEWYALEIEPSDKQVAERFCWSGEQSLVPYFKVRYQGQDYTSRDMGLGEFSVHFLFWILEQYRHVDNLTLLLDEPDAYLPPIGVSSFLARILDLCLRRDWQAILATHSEEMISQAEEHEAFVLMRTGEQGKMIAHHIKDHPKATQSLLTRPAVSHVLFCEDESAWYLTYALLEAVDRRLARTSAVIWGNGHGYLRKLRAYIPRTQRPQMRFAFVFDGDQRNSVKASSNSQWDVLFLPTNGDPDSLFKSLGKDSRTLAAKLDLCIDELNIFLDSIEAFDQHDWVDELAREYGRPYILRSLAALWVEKNVDEVSNFSEQVRRI